MAKAVAAFTRSTLLSLFPSKTQPKKGNINTHRVSKSILRQPSAYDPQIILNRKRRILLNSLPRDSNHRLALAKYTKVGTGELVFPDSAQTPSYTDSSAATVTPLQRRREKKTKSRLHSQSPNNLLEKNTFRSMWNGMMVRGTSEQYWLEWEKVNAKMIALKKKHRPDGLYALKELQARRLESRLIAMLRAWEEGEDDGE